MDMSETTTATTDEPRHPIQVVARRTGVTQDSLRAWEKRYRAVRPHRARGGRRLYTDADIERLLLIRRALDAGRRIGQVAVLPTDELRALVAQDEEALARAPQSRPGRAVELSGIASHRETCLEAALALDAELLHARLSLARAELSLPVLLDEVLSPILEELGTRWYEGTLRVAHEHLLSTMVRSVLSPVIANGGAGPAAPAIVVTTPAGQRHELGALMAAAAAGADGWRVTYMGPDLPADEIALAVKEVGAKALVLSIIYPGDDPELPKELERLRTMVGDHVAVFAGGRAAGDYGRALDGIGARRQADLRSLRESLRTLRQSGI
jgi:DNA-binding transcriptional MerR regulator/methylmalonyl-CoA mutase cobalamin-binding subunit